MNLKTFLYVTLLITLILPQISTGITKSNHVDHITEEHIIQEINNIFFNETGNFTVEDPPPKITTPSRFSFGESDFYNFIDQAQNFMSHQINTAEKSMNELEIRARESFNLTGILLNQLIVDTDSALHEFRSQIQDETRNRKISECLDDSSNQKIKNIIQAARPEIRECAHLANVNMNKSLRRMQRNVVEISEKISLLRKIGKVCFAEPGIGEKLNCFLGKILNVGQILDQIVSIFRRTVSNTAANFAENIKKASVCMTQISHEAIKDINGLIVVARECAQSNTIDLQLDERTMYNNNDNEMNDDEVSEVTTKGL